MHSTYLHVFRFFAANQAFFPPKNFQFRPQQKYIPKGISQVVLKITETMTQNILPISRCILEPTNEIKTYSIQYIM